MVYNTIRLEREGPVAVLKINRPQRLNAMNKEALGEIQAALDEVEADDRLRALVVTGEGEHFSSGFDLKEQMEAGPSGVAAWREILDRDFKTIMRFWNLRKPTVAAVRGYCLAGGFELALACDVTIASTDAVFGEPELKFGAGIVVMLLPWLVGPKRAKAIIFSGADRIQAQDAYQMGLVNRLVAPDEVFNAAMSFARDVSVIDPGLVRDTKRAVNRTFEIMGLLEALEAALDIDLAIEGAGSPDKQKFMEIAREKGLKDAIEWRDTRFGGRGDR